MLEMGILLSSQMKETEIAGKKVYSVADDFLIACFDNDVTEETVKAVARKSHIMQYLETVPWQMIVLHPILTRYLHLLARKQ